MQINRFEYDFLVIQAHNEFKAWPWSWNAFSKTLLPFVLPSLHTVCLVSDDNRELTWAFTSSPHPIQVHFSSQDNDVTGHWPSVGLWNSWHWHHSTAWNTCHHYHEIRLWSAGYCPETRTIDAETIWGKEMLIWSITQAGWDACITESGAVSNLRTGLWEI